MQKKFQVIVYGMVFLKQGGPANEIVTITVHKPLSEGDGVKELVGVVLGVTVWGMLGYGV